jgi:glycine oxidase
MTQTVGIVGAGLMGRLLALMLSEQGWHVSLFEKNDVTVPNSCAFVGAGMLSPISELETAEPLIAKLGFDALALWQTLIQKLDLPVYFRKSGTLIVSHNLDFPVLDQFRQTLQNKLKHCETNQIPQEKTEPIRWKLNQFDLQALEPQLSTRFQQGIYIPDEGQIDNRQLLLALEHQFKKARIHCHFNTPVQQLKAHQIQTPTETHDFDWVIDCRGLGTKPDWKTLRGVRGEIIRVHAPEVSLQRPVRLMHPRYPLYIAPRENHHYVIGATSIESEDTRPITLQSSMELLSAAFSIHPGFAEASIIEASANSRPALPDHLPKIQMQSGLIRVNGLYRHGFLIAPQLAQLVANELKNLPIQPVYQSLFENTDVNVNNPTPKEAHALYATTY